MIQNRMIIICVITLAISACSDTETSYMGANYSSLSSCLSAMKRKSKLKIVIDKPDKVTGNFSNGEFFACTKKTSGTKGTYFEGYYSVTKKKK